MKWREYWPATNLALIAAGLLGLVFTLLDDDGGLNTVLSSMFSPALSQEFILRWILVLLVLALVYLFAIGFAYKDRPITVIRTRIDISFCKEDASIVRIKQTQILRANQHGVTAYFSQHKPDHGRIPKANIHASAYCLGCDVDGGFNLRGSETGTIHLMQIFRKELPHFWYMPLVPIWWLNKDYEHLHNVWKRRVVRREYEICYEDEYNVEEPVMSFTAQNYKRMNIAVNFNFGKFCKPDDFQVRRIVRSGVVDVHSHHDPSKNVSSLYLDKLQNETLWITWRSKAKVPSNEIETF